MNTTTTRRAPEPPAPGGLQTGARRTVPVTTCSGRQVRVDLTFGPAHITVENEGTACGRLERAALRSWLQNCHVSRIEGTTYLLAEGEGQAIILLPGIGLWALTPAEAATLLEWV